MNDIEFLKKLINDMPTDPPPHLISEYIQGKRVLPLGSPKPGPIDLHLTPYAIEIMDAAGPYSGVNKITVMKGVQIALTTLLENILAYYIGGNPSEQMYCTASDALLKKWIKRLTQLISSCDFKDLISAQGDINSKSRRTGDSMYSKEYPGGSLSMASLQSPASMRSESNRVLLIDEVDGAPAETTTGEGNFLGILEGRTAAYGSTWKIISTSTPALQETSIIYPEFLAGDRRYYNVPCFKCGTYFVLQFDKIRPMYDKHGYLDKVFHECPNCNKEIWESEKTEMMKVDTAYWEPTATPTDRTHRSYQISALYSPFMSWARIYGMYLKTQDDPTRLPSFRNLYEGIPFKEEGHRPDISRVIALRGDYNSKEVQEGVIFLTLSADVQRGAEKYQKMSPAELTEEIERLKKQGKNLWTAKLPRIELEVLGHGAKYRSWSIDYQKFYGHTTLGAFEGAFEKMKDWAADNKLTYYRADGVAFPVMIATVDATDGLNQGDVFDFCEDFGRNTYPNINMGWLKQKKDPHKDEEDSKNYDRYRIAKKGSFDAQYIQVSTNHYKKQVYKRINKSITTSDKETAEYCDFPRDRADHYFDMLTAEELRPDGSFHNGGRNAEALDVRGYNLCGADVWLESEIRKAQDRAKKAGMAENEVKKIDKKYILNFMENRIKSMVR